MQAGALGECDGSRIGVPDGRHWAVEPVTLCIPLWLKWWS